MSLTPCPAVLEHERYAQLLLPWSIGLAVVAILQWVWFRWGKTALHNAERFRTATTGGVLLAVAVIVSSIGSLTAVILTGDSGSRAMWGDLIP